MFILENQYIKMKVYNEAIELLACRSQLSVELRIYYPTDIFIF